MYKSKTIQLLNKYYDTLDIDREPTPEERSFVKYIEFDIAKTIIEEFGNEYALSISKIMQSYVESVDR